MKAKGTTDAELAGLVAQAKQGDTAALESVINAVQDQVHHLAVRILVDREEARDATQEILILVPGRDEAFDVSRRQCV